MGHIQALPYMGEVSKSNHLVLVHVSLVFGLKTGVRTYSQWATYGPQSSGIWTSSSSTFLKINWPATTMKENAQRDANTAYWL